MREKEWMSVGRETEVGMYLGRMDFPGSNDLINHSLLAADVSWHASHRIAA